MPQPSKGNRKQIAGRLPLEVYEAFERRRELFGLAQNDALISAIKKWSRDDPPPDPTQDPTPRRPAPASSASELVPLAGTFERKPYQKGQKK